LPRSTIPPSGGPGAALTGIRPARRPLIAPRTRQTASTGSAGSRQPGAEDPPGTTNSSRSRCSAVSRPATPDGPRSHWRARTPAGPRTVSPRLGTVLAGDVEGALGRVEPVTCGIERFFGGLHRGQGIAQRILSIGQPAPQVRQLPRRLPASPRPANHTIEDHIRCGGTRPCQPRARPGRLITGPAMGGGL